MKTPEGRYRVVIGHHHRRYLFFDTREEAQKAFRIEVYESKARDRFRERLDTEAENLETEKRITEKR